MEVIFILHNGIEKRVTFRKGQTLLAIADENDIKLNSNCEGFGVCGGCHVYIENLQDKLPKVSERENDTLDRVSNLSMRSRLACQVVLDESLDGLRVRLV